jgi:hypothetical protein
MTKTSKDSLKFVALLFAAAALITSGIAWLPSNGTATRHEKQQIVANPVGWAKLVSTPVQVGHVNMLWQVDFQFSDSETLTAMIVEGGNMETVNSRTWKIGDEVFISSIPGKGHQHRPSITYIVIDHRSAAEAAEDASK